MAVRADKVEGGLGDIRALELSIVVAIGRNHKRAQQVARARQVGRRVDMGSVF